MLLKVVFIKYFKKHIKWNKLKAKVFLGGVA
jgi:hypothetical protein